MVFSSFAHQETHESALAQTCLKSAVVFNGIGTHSGAPVTMTILPAEADTGIHFIRTDITDKDNIIPALWHYVTDTTMCTKITNEEGVSVSTIEHILAALYACEIDNACIEINGPEVPIMDGSSHDFIAPLLQAERTTLEAPRRQLEILRPIIVRDKADRWVSISPSEHFYIECEFDFNGRADFSTQLYKGIMTPAHFLNDIAQARTFGFVEDVVQLRSLGLAQGSSLENAIGIQDNRVLNPEGLRFEDEFVRHKVLDVVGDMFTAGMSIKGHIRGARTGHGLSNQLLRAVFSDPKNWRII